MSRQMPVTIKDVSNDAKVSIKTVSRVINKEKNVAEKTRELVVKSIQKLGFKPNRSAQSLRSRKSHMIALLYDNPNKHYLADIQRGILRLCKETGYNLVIHECDYTDPQLALEISKFIDDFQNIVTDYMKTSSFSVGISDLIGDEQTNQKIISTVNEKKKEVHNLINQLHLGVFENSTGKTNETEFRRGGVTGDLVQIRRKAITRAHNFLNFR